VQQQVEDRGSPGRIALAKNPTHRGTFQFRRGFFAPGMCTLRQHAQTRRFMTTAGGAGGGRVGREPVWPTLINLDEATNYPL